MPLTRFHSHRLTGIAANLAGLVVATTVAFAQDSETVTTPLPVAFTGVAAGDATGTNAIVWTRALVAASPGPVTLSVNVSPDSNFVNNVSTFAGVTDTNKDYTLKLNAAGLLPGTKYFYQFVGTGSFTGASGLGTFKTAPGTNAPVAVKFGFSGDMDGLMRPYALASTLGAQQLDFYVNLGDVIYENASNVRGNIGQPYTNSPSVTLSGSAANLNGVPVAGTTFATQAQLKSEYEKKYRENFLPVNLGGQNCLQDLYAAQGNYTTWDNHELGNRQYINGGAPAGGSVGGANGLDMPTGRGVDARNNGSGNVGNTNDVNTSTTDFMNRAPGFLVLQQVFMNYQPITDRTVNAPSDPRSHGTKQLYSAQQWGRHAILINTDSRSYRDIRIKTANGGADDTTAPRANNPNRTFLGATQLAWLKQTLLDAHNAGVPWKFVSLSDPIDQLGPIGGALSGTLTSVNADGGKSYIGGYRAERNALLKFIADNGIRNVVFLSTDDHQNRVNELTYSPAGQTEVQGTYVRVPRCFSIVDGPLGATGPDTITDHSFANLAAIANSLANAQTTAGLDPVGLDANYPGLINVTREGDPNANTLRQPIDFYSPDTFNYNTLEVSADGRILTVKTIGINSTPQNSASEYDPINNPAREILSFQIAADPEPVFTACPGPVITVTNDIGRSNALVSFFIAASGVPTPSLNCTVTDQGGQASTFTGNNNTFSIGTNTVACVASNNAGTATCNFTVIVRGDRPRYQVNARGFVLVDWGQVEVRYSAPGSGNFGTARIVPAGFAYDPISNTTSLTTSADRTGIVATVNAETGNVRAFTLARGAKVQVKAVTSAP